MVASGTNQDVRFETTSCTAVLILKKGDCIWVRLRQGHVYGHSPRNCSTESAVSLEDLIKDIESSLISELFFEQDKVTTRHSLASCLPPPETIKFNDDDHARVRTFRLSEKAGWRQNTITVLRKTNIQNTKNQPTARANLTLLRTLLTNFLISSTVH